MCTVSEPAAGEEYGAHLIRTLFKQHDQTNNSKDWNEKYQTSQEAVSESFPSRETLHFAETLEKDHDRPQTNNDFNCYESK